MKVLVFGSLNIDHVYQVPHFLRPGETMDSLAYSRNAGGKGLNQAIALARAGMDTAFAGAIGQDGLFLRQLLEATGVDTARVQVLDAPPGMPLFRWRQGAAMPFCCWAAQTGASPRKWQPMRWRECAPATGCCCRTRSAAGTRFCAWRSSGD